MTTLWRKALQSLETIRGDLGVYDGANRVYSDSNPPQSFMRTQFAPASLVTPAAGFADESTPDGKSLWMKAPDGTLTLIGPNDDPEPIAMDHGYKSWAFDPVVAFGTAAPTSGVLQLVKMPLRAPTSISSVSVVVNTVGATLTNVGFALYTAAGALITSSVNANGATAAAFQTGTGEKVVTFTAQTISAPFYLGFWFAGTTIPILHKSNAGASVANVKLAAPNFRWAVANTGLTTAAPATLGTQTTGPNPWWAAAA